MNLEERIDRRLADSEPRLVQDYEALSPVAHPAEPSDRGQILEELLDHLETAFDGGLAPTVHVWGPKGSGKSAVTAALFDRLADRTRRSRAAIPTTTRAERVALPSFAYVDARDAGSDFGLYRAVLAGLADGDVPRQGVSTETLREMLADRLADDRGVVAVDHVGEPGTQSPGAVADLFEPLSGSVAWVTVGRTPPTELDWTPDHAVEVGAYDDHALVDVLTDRTSAGLMRRALSHEGLRRVVEWADGDAHDALAAVFAAAVTADRAGRDSIRRDDLEAGMDDVPWQGASLGRILALRPNRQRVLYELVGLDPAERESVTAAAKRIADAPGVDLSASTVTRVLYELADDDVVRRVARDAELGQGRPPSRVEPRFPTLVFRRLFELQQTE
jgi:Cdc6-like AAA superfamily ATPase